MNDRTGASRSTESASRRAFPTQEDEFLRVAREADTRPPRALTSYKRRDVRNTVAAVRGV